MVVSSVVAPGVVLSPLLEAVLLGTSLSLYKGFFSSAGKNVVQRTSVGEINMFDYY